VGLKKWLSVERYGLGVIFDLSPRGARVMTEVAINPGDHIAISLRLPNQTSAMLVEEATVRWGNNQTYGVEFNRFSTVADMRLRKFLHQASTPSSSEPL
jgi:hypothetical protein